MLAVASPTTPRPTFTPLVTPVDVLDGMLTTWSSPQAWTKGVSARDEKGRPVLPTEARATCFCFYGNMELQLHRLAPDDADLVAALEEEVDRLTMRVLRDRTPDIHGPSLINDDATTSFEDMVALVAEVRSRAQLSCASQS